MMLNEALVSATTRLKNYSETPALDAQVLLAHSLGKNRTWLIAHAKEPVNADQFKQFDELVSKREHGTPVSYLTGEQEFWSLSFVVTQDTLIPRPETELLVELALEKIPAGGSFNLADIGTGSGAIALAIASERKQCRVIASDISMAALDVARINSKQLNIENVSFEHGAGLQPFKNKKFDLIISNPPYVAATDPHLQQGDVRFEPKSALVAGVDGLDVIRTLVKESAEYLHDDGWLMIEHGYDQEQAIELLFNEAGYKNFECYRDLADLPRVSIGQK